LQPPIQEIFKNLPFTESETTTIANTLEKVTLKKKDFLLKAAQEVNHMYYVQSGCLRTYFIDPAGKEHTLQFAIKGWWTSDYIALFGKGKLKSISYIECIRDATVFKVSKKDFDAICREMPKVSRFHIENLEGAFAAFHRRILENLTLSAKERYVRFVSTYPDIEQEVKNYHVASFLGITTESLSRIRKELASE
jgi:CRP-like cAMP-binding protein